MSKDSLESNANARTTARRRLVRGVFAAPAALTLYSGRALAASSTSCVDKQQDAPLNAPSSNTDGSGVDGTWVRVPVWSVTGNDSFSISKWVSGADMLDLIPKDPLVPAPYLLANEWQAFVIGKNSSYKSQLPGYTTSTKPSEKGQGNVTVYATKDGTYVAVRISGLGKIEAIQPLSSAHTALGTSCWTSFGGVNF